MVETLLTSGALVHTGKGIPSFVGIYAAVLHTPVLWNKMVAPCH